jgi:hypothetical protein
MMDMDRESVKLLLTYDPIPERREAYIRYVLGEFVPALEHLGLSMCEAWHTAYGEYPLRLNAFVASDEPSMEDILASDEFRDLETRLQEYVENYRRRIVPVRERFQF